MSNRTILSKKPQTPTERNLGLEFSGNESFSARLVALTPVKKNLTEPAAPVVTPTKNLLERLSSVLEIVQADKEAVTYREQLSLMADLYSGCLDGELLHGQ